MHTIEASVATAASAAARAMGKQIEFAVIDWLEVERALSLCLTALAELARLAGPPGESARLAEAMAAMLARVSGQVVTEGHDQPLTTRERQVALLVGQCLSNREIAQQLVVGERTVEVHVRNCLGKLGFRSRTQLALWAVMKQR